MIAGREPTVTEPTGTRRRAMVALAALLALVLAPASTAAAPASSGSDPAAGTTSTVEGELGPEGGIREARVRRHHRDPDTGRRRETVEPIGAEAIPIVVQVRYELDGRSVTADELRGATGEAAVHVQLRNPTGRPRTVAAAGEDGPREEVELSLPLLADVRLALDDSWYAVRADAGRVAAAEDAGTHVTWSSALFEPVASPRARLELRAEVEDAALPRIEVEAVPADAATSDLLDILGDRATDEGTSEAVAAFVAEALGTGIDEASEGARQLVGGLERAAGGAEEINAAISGMQEELGGGFSELQEGLERLDRGLARVAEGLDRIEQGLAEVGTGVEQLREGLGEAADGARRLRDDVAAPAEDGVRELWAVLAEEFSVGRADPAYPDALSRLGELYALLTGEAPPLEDLETDAAPAPEGLDPQEQEQYDALVGELTGLLGTDPSDSDAQDPGPPGEGNGRLEEYPGLTAALDGLAEGVGEAAEGAGQLAEALGGLQEGVAEIRSGLEELRTRLDEAAPDLPAGQGDPGELGQGLGEFESGLHELASGGGELAGGLQRLGEGGEELLRRLEDELEAADLDRARIEALSERAGEATEEDGDDGGAGGHDRYRLVFHEPAPDPGPVAALGGLTALAVALEVLRRALARA